MHYFAFHMTWELFNGVVSAVMVLLELRLLEHSQIFNLFENRA